MKRYCYRFPDNNERAKLLRKYWHEAVKAEQEAQRYAKSMGADEWLSDPNFFGGGVAYLIFNKKPDEQLWRKGTVVDGVDCYEPNVRVVQMMVRVKKGLKPSDTWNTVYRRLPMTFEQVRNRYTLKAWAQIAHYILSGKDDKDWKKIESIVSGDDFYDLARIYPVTTIKTDRFGKEHPNRMQRRAVSAMKLRLRLPVVRTDELYKIMDADLAAVDENGNKIKSQQTPTFFHYWKSYYFSSDYPCKGDDLTEINFGEYGTALRDAQQLDEQTKKAEEARQ